MLEFHIHMKISDLVQAPATQLAAEAQRRGMEVLGHPQEANAGSVHFLGLCQLLVETRDELAKARREISELKDELNDLGLEMYAIFQHI